MFFTNVCFTKKISFCERFKLRPVFSVKNTPFTFFAFLPPLHVNFLKKNLHASGEKSKKREGGVFHRQDWSQFKPFAKRNLFCKTNICEKHPLIAKKWVFILKKLFYKYFTSFFYAAWWPNI